MTAATHHPLTGLDELDAHRHINRAVADLLDDIDHRQDRERVDAIDKPCKDHPALARAVAAIHVRHAAHIRKVTHLQRALRNEDLDESRRLADELADSAAGVAAAIDLAHQGLDVGCNHTCPELPRRAGDVDRFTAQLVDRLEAAGFALARSTP